MRASSGFRNAISLPLTLYMPDQQSIITQNVQEQITRDRELKARLIRAALKSFS